jgi:glycosyltransferase involved in cell wall biosynthesis
MTQESTLSPDNPRPIKVMHIIARLNIGGAAIYVIQLAAALNHAGCEAQLVCGVVGKTEGDMRYIADEQGLPLTIIPSLGREISPTGDLITLWRLWQLIRRERPDIVHTHTAKAGFVGRVAAWLAGVPIIIHTFHGHVFAGYFGKRKTQVFLTLERLCAGISTRIVTLSQALKHELATVYNIAPEDKFDIIELGFDLDPLVNLPTDRSAFRKQNNIPADVPLVGIVGRLVPVKNHELFFQVASLVAQQNPDVHFAIVGDGERRAELESLAHSLNLTDRVHFTGWIKDPAPVYAALSALVLCSKNEGLPVSLIEAMAAGVPAISTAVGGASDLLDDGRLGAVVPPEDPSALAQAILRALTDPVARQVTVEARQVAVDRYGINRSTQETLALYQRLMQDRANKPS